MANNHEAHLAALLSRTGLLDDALIRQVMEADRTEEGGLVGAAVRLGGLREEDFLAKLAPLVGMSFTPLGKLEPDKPAIERLPARAVFQYRVVPLKFERGVLTVATSDPFNTGMADGLRLTAGGPVRLTLSTRDDIEKASRKYYGVGADTVEKMMADGRFDADADADLAKADLSQLGQEASIVRFVNQIIAEADRQGATDIHFEPMEQELRIRYRIDGLLHKVDVPSQLNRLKAAITSRLKVMANLDIAEKRMPMDGRIGIRVNGQDIDIRVSTMPTVYGESVSLRLLQKSENFVRLGELGMHPDDQTLIEKVIHRPNGIVLVTGPTGSGKSTSLYAFLHEINRMDVRILTAEDPIEYEMPGVNQVAVKSDIGLTFSRILRSFLRQDPDIVMVGEIRDAETAEIAINASLTGHLVLSTLHTNDAAGAFVRLIDMGVEPFLVASAVAAVMAQRLVRRLCVHCRRAEPLDLTRFGELQPPAGVGAEQAVYFPVGCELCSQTGYRGRGGIFELLNVTDTIESLVIARHSSTDIRQQALKEGMRTLRDDGWRKILQGVTTLEEVLRVTEENT
ncbi:MAG: ATPase, T2SS/T4P/T4SS family [Kiritimatiellae bacterium]|nr:ATPase, T2SS/T4P/T4SS family [Kiritimatiellia bacterium]